jgi:hypothetical protein
MRVLGKSTLDGSILIHDSMVVFAELGIKEKQKPKQRKHLKFNHLDDKSIRIMNRLTKYLNENKISISKALEPVSFYQ